MTIPFEATNWLFLSLFASALFMSTSFWNMMTIDTEMKNSKLAKFVLLPGFYTLVVLFLIALIAMVIMKIITIIMG
jgi:hypothetical protein